MIPYGINLVYKILYPLKAADTFREPLIFNGNKLKLEAFRSNWPPARTAYAPEGMMECWNNGTMGSGIMQFGVNDKICV